MTTNFPSISFSASLPDLLIEGVSQDYAVVALTVGGTGIYSEQLYPDTSGRISVLSLNRMITQFMRRRSLLQISLTLTVTPMSSSSTTKTCTVYYSEVDIQDTTFANSRFLTMCDGVRYSNLGRREYLYSRTSSASAVRTYNDGSTATNSLSSSGSSSGIYLFDLTSLLAPVSGKRLVSMTVTSGSRSQQYIILPDDDDDVECLVFKNAFGLRETMYFDGTLAIKPSYKRSEIIIGRAVEHYDIDETVSHESTTGHLTDGMVKLFRDVLRSYDIRLLSTGQQVVITDSKADGDNDDDRLIRMSLTWMLAQTVQTNDGAFSGRIFDDTFDYTFN